METEQKKWGISGSTLKLIAIITMAIDHVGAALLGRYVIASGYINAVYSSDMNAIIEWMAENGTLFMVYTTMRMIGRVAFPIFCFLMVEGFMKTRDVRKYALRLGLFALISEIPFDLAFNAKVLEFTYQNVFFTLFIGMLTMMAFDTIEKRGFTKGVRVLLYGIALAVGACVAELLMTDYGAIGVICIMVLYLFRRNRKSQIVAGCVAFCWELTAMLAFIPIGFYNGSRGMKLKYFFYAFYPLHLLVIYLIAMYLGMAGYTAF